MRRAVLLALLAAGTASAQGPLEPMVDTALEVAIQAPGERIVPLGPFIALGVQVTYRYMDVYPELEATPITLRVAEVDPAFVATVSPATLHAPSSFQPCGCEREVVLQSFLLVSATQAAPAFRASAVVVEAQAPAHHVYKAANASASVEVQADYFARVQASARDQHFRLAPGGSAAAEGMLSNQGNGATLVTFRLDAEPPAGLEVLLPAPLRLGARQQGEAAEAVTQVGFRAASAFNDTRVTVHVLAASAEEPSAASTHATRLTFNVLADRGVGAVLSRAPGPEVVGAALALALGAAARRW